VVLASRINLALFKFSNTRTRRLMRYRSTLYQLNAFELATIIKHYLVVLTMALLRFLVSRIETPGKKTKTCQPFNTQSSYWYSKHIGTRFSKTLSCSMKRLSKLRKIEQNRLKTSVFRRNFVSRNSKRRLKRNERKTKTNTSCLKV